MAAISKILIVRLSSIGDIILATPLLRSLKKAFPEAWITFVVKKQYEELLSQSPCIDELILFDSGEGLTGLRKIKDHLREQHFDLFLDIHKNWRSHYIRLGLGARKITTYRKLIFRRTMLVWFKINFYGQIKPVYERYFDAVKDLGVHYDDQGTEIHVPADKLEMVKNLLSDAGYAFDAPLITLCPSATYFNKRWTSDGFVETAKYLISRKSAFIVVHGGKEDIDLCAHIASTIGQRAVSFAGQLSLSGSAALLKHSDLIIANDSGLLHLAQSQKKPVIGIYGATTRELGYFPIEHNSSVIETDLPCRPCTHNGLDRCPRKHFRCMKDIPASKVIEAAMHYLS